MPTYKPLTLELIDEGRFLEAAGEAMAELQHELLTHVRKHGTDASAGSKAVLTLQIGMTFGGRADNDYTVTAALKKTLPAPPVSATMAMPGEKEDSSDLALFVRATGSTAQAPEQQVLCTQDGETVDADTGEVSDGDN